MELLLYCNCTTWSTDRYRLMIGLIFFPGYQGSSNKLNFLLIAQWLNHSFLDHLHSRLYSITNYQFFKNRKYHTFLFIMSKNELRRENRQR